MGVSIPEKSTPDRWVTALIDSGADTTLIPLDILIGVGAEVVDTARLRGILGQSQVVKLHLVTLYLGSHVVRAVRAVAVGPGEEVILGRDVLNQLVITLNGLASVTEVRA